jgi:hypothetical protein
VQQATKMRTLEGDSKGREKTRGIKQPTINPCKYL